ncbi:hypothetical protein EVAR_33490_1 [Eumeta japonica]|uniref:Uncharacterized protein n=1 Tax=Eumeta variegata TaxID=151549 RepID=A0A4C1WI02_EUMVA|nr:hypothetical protein EVAR_33490_1 [Eumeta japonica]
MSSVYVAYELGDKQLPYGTPARIGREADSALLTATQKLRWWRKPTMALVSTGGSGVSSSLWRRPLCHNLSKAFSPYPRALPPYTRP